MSKGTTSTSSGSSRRRLMDYVRAEVTRGYQLELEEERFQARREKIYMIMTVPRELERLMGYGFFQCADAFLFLFTYLPLRVALKLSSICLRGIKSVFRFRSPEVKAPLFRAADRCDFLKLFILLITIYLSTYIDTSVLYHMVKSQSVIKLYIFFNMLEVGDRLFASFVQDTIDALLLTATEENREEKDKSSPRWGVLAHFLLTIAAVFGHALVLLLQGTTLSVAINASNRALLTVMMSNNFVELKGSVFKKFDKINLFQVSCSDIRERFHLCILLLVVCLQTMREYSWEEERFWVLFPDCVMVLLAEVTVDWLKHAFITRFNELSTEVYREYTVSIAYDLAQTKQRKAFSDHSDMVGRRLGFVPLPLAVVLARVLRPCISHGDAGTIILTFLGFVALASFRTLNSIILLGKACDLIDQHVAAQGNTGTVSAPASSAVNSPSHHQVKALPVLSSLEIPEIPPKEPTRAPTPNPPVPLQQDHLPELPRKSLERKDSKNPNPGRSYSASHTPRPSIGSINDLPPPPTEYNLENTKLLQANSLVSILSANFNEEMKMKEKENKEPEKENKEPGKMRRKHSLGSNLAESEGVLLAQKKEEDQLIVETCEKAVIGLDEGEIIDPGDPFASFGSPWSDSILEQTTFELDKLIPSLEGEEEADRTCTPSPIPPVNACGDNSTPNNTENSGGRVRHRSAKKKSISEWFKELGSSSSKVSNSNENSNNNPS